MSNREIAVTNDNKIYEMAMYEVTKGQTIKLSSQNLYSSTLNKFGEFKRLIIKKEFSMKQLEEDVYGRYGIIEETPLEALKNMSDEIKRREINNSN